MLQTIGHQFSVQFSLLFPMVYSVLLLVLHFKTTPLMDPDWLLKLFHQSGVEVSEANTASKMEHSTWKSNENWTENWCRIVCSILFGLFLCVTSSEAWSWKMIWAFLQLQSIFYYYPKEFDISYCPSHHGQVNKSLQIVWARIEGTSIMNTN